MKDFRLQHLNRWAAGLLDLTISRDPLSQEVIMIYNTVIRDQYQDATHSEDGRYKKIAKVKKNVDMHYVQELGDVLLEDEDAIPWVISMTITNLPRLPKTDDMILIEGVKYTISFVKPMNRDLPNIILMLVYPERSFQEDPLIIQDTTWFDDSKTVLDVLYGGYPVQFSFDKVKWIPFRSYIKCKYDLGKTFKLYLKDPKGVIVSREITR